MPLVYYQPYTYPMNVLITTIGSLFLTITIHLAVAQQPSLDGSWKLTQANGQAVTGMEVIAICQDNYFMFGQYRPNGSFISAGGGAYQLVDDQFQITYDFNTENSAQVRVPQQYTAELTQDRFSFQNQTAGKQTWERVSEETTPLTGTWLFAARVDEEGNEGERRGPGPRMTVKILSGGRFQWAAFNYETKEFSGTGGGTYEADNSTYTENIEFFSRDDSRVGGSLSFQYRRTGNDWYHEGKNSRGEPLHEVWTQME